MLEEQLLALHSMARIGLLPPQPLGGVPGGLSPRQGPFAMVHSDCIMSMVEARALMHTSLDNLSDETAQSESSYCCGANRDRFATGRLSSPEFRWSSDQGVTSATCSGVDELAALADYIQQLTGAQELMAALYEVYVNSPLAQVLPECRAAHAALRSGGLPVPVMETSYEGTQRYGPLGLNEYAVHKMSHVAEGDIVCMRDGPDRIGAATPHRFGLGRKGATWGGR